MVKGDCLSLSDLIAMQIVRPGWATKHLFTFHFSLIHFDLSSINLKFQFRIKCHVLFKEIHRLQESGILKHINRTPISTFYNRRLELILALSCLQFHQLINRLPLSKRFGKRLLSPAISIQGINLGTSLSSKRLRVSLNL